MITNQEWVWSLRPWGIHAALECGQRFWKPGKIIVFYHKDVTIKGERSRGFYFGNFIMWWGRDVAGSWQDVA